MSEKNEQSTDKWEGAIKLAARDEAVVSPPEEGEGPLFCMSQDRDYILVMVPEVNDEGERVWRAKRATFKLNSLEDLPEQDNV